MNQIDPASLHNAYASKYDQQVIDSGCFITDILFGLVFEYLEPGQKLLDAGIGSGLSSQLFDKAGLEIHGMDFAREMLEICQGKEIGSTLVQHDVMEMGWPYPREYFDLVINCGVTHFLPNLENLFSEAKRVIKKGGWFAFTTKAADQKEKYQCQMIDGFNIYSHSYEYIQKLIYQSGFSQKKVQKYFIGKDLLIIWTVHNDINTIQLIA